MSDLNLIQIQAPELSSSNYGGGVKTQFDNIDKNFKTLGNHDFIKGDSGSGYAYELATLTGELPPAVEPNDAWSEEWVNYKIKTAILNNLESTDDKEACISTLEGQTVMVYYLGAPDSDVKTYVGIQSFPFYDGRLKGIAGSSNIEGFSDQTGIICTSIENDEVTFHLLQGFPVIYYDENVGALCWKIGGQETGLTAQGPRGPQGANGYLLMVKSDVNGVIQNMYVDNSWRSSNYPKVQEVLSEILINSERMTTLAFVLNDPSGSYSESGNTIIYLSDVTVTTEVQDHTTTYIGHVRTDFPFNFEIDATWFQDLDYTNTGDAKYAKGLFVPYVPGMLNDDGAHVIYAQPATGVATNKKLTITPTANIADLSTPDPQAELELQYLSAAMKSSTVSVSTVFDRLYRLRDGVTGGEQRFSYIWKSTNKDTGSSYPEPGNSDTRPDFSTFSSNVFEAYMCPDGFLWYKDPYTYLRVELRNGKVMIVGPNNGEVSVGAKSLTPENPTMTAAETTVNAVVGADSYWKIEKV